MRAWTSTRPAARRRTRSARLRLRRLALLLMAQKSWLSRPLMAPSWRTPGALHARTHACTARTHACTARTRAARTRARARAAAARCVTCTPTHLDADVASACSLQR
jgi:hypothetical protein